MGAGQRQTVDPFRRLHARGRGPTDPRAFRKALQVVRQALRDMKAARRSLELVDEEAAREFV
jgi:hypothetical protein